MSPVTGDSDCHKYMPFETEFRINDGLLVDFRFWIADFGFKVFCLFYK